MAGFDYNALAAQSGAVSSQPAGVDYDAMAKQSGAVSSQPAKATTGNAIGDSLAGAGGAAAQHAVNIYDMLRSYMLMNGVPYKALPDSTDVHKAISDATPENRASRVGRFLEGIAEFAMPSGKVAEATKGMGLVARAGAQAAVGGGVSAVQSGGDPTATATGAALGAGGEVLGAAAGAATKALGTKSPTLANFSESFGGATPTQKARISKALPTLERDGVVPPDGVHDMQDVIKGKLDEIGQQYNALDPAIKTREVDPGAVVSELQKAQAPYLRRGVVTNAAADSTISNQIKTIQDIAAANGGKLTIDDLIHMKVNANGQTAWNSPDVEKSLWNNIGDAYRRAADNLAPETTPLNQDYQKYKDLEQIVDQNIARGKGVAPTGLDLLTNKIVQHGTGAAAGAAAGHAIAGPAGAAVGSVVGGIVGPKLGKAAGQALQNAVDSGAFSALSPAKQGLVRAMSAMGDNAGVLKILGTSVSQETAAGR